MNHKNQENKENQEETTIENPGKTVVAVMAAVIITTAPTIMMALQTIAKVPKRPYSSKKWPSPLQNIYN